MDNIGLIQTDPHLILSNSKVWTAFPSLSWAEVVAISGGRITAVGRNAEVVSLRSPRTQLLELSGELVLPGIFNSHTHLLRGPFTLISLSIRQRLDASAVYHDKELAHPVK
jgi:predicted amidohydrolase YtcJ